MTLTNLAVLARTASTLYQAVPRSTETLVRAAFPPLRQGAVIVERDDATREARRNGRRAMAEAHVTLSDLATAVYTRRHRRFGKSAAERFTDWVQPHLPGMVVVLLAGPGVENAMALAVHTLGQLIPNFAREHARAETSLDAAMELGYGPVSADDATATLDLILTLDATIRATPAIHARTANRRVAIVRALIADSSVTDVELARAAGVDRSTIRADRVAIGVALQEVLRPASEPEPAVA